MSAHWFDRILAKLRPVVPPEQRVVPPEQRVVPPEQRVVTFEEASAELLARGVELRHCTGEGWPARMTDAELALFVDAIVAKARDGVDWQHEILLPGDRTP